MLGIAFVIGACILWAIDTLIRYPLLGQGVSAEGIVFSEHLILTLIFLPYLIKNYKKVWGAQVSHVFYFLLIGGVGSALATLSFTRAFTIINPSLVILLQKLQPLVAVSLAAVVLKEPIKKQYLIWAVLCLIGGMLISYNDIFPGLMKGDFSNALDSKNLLGYGLTLIAVIGWGSATVFGKKISSLGYNEKDLMAGRFLFGFFCLLPFLAGGNWPLSSVPIVWGKIVLMVALSGILGMYFYYQGLKRLPARLCALAEMFFPFCAIAVNWVFLDATLAPAQIVGGILLLIGSTVIQLKHY